MLGTLPDRAPGNRETGHPAAPGWHHGGHMPDEVERKFRVADVPASLGDGTRLRQAYVAVDRDHAGDDNDGAGRSVEVRVRDQGGTYLLTVKGGRGLRRTEVEIEIGRTEFDELWALAADRRIEKTRYRIPLDDDLVAELDIYDGPLEGLVVVEVEFSSPDAADSFTPPSWFGDEVTGDSRYANADLAGETTPPS
jgi:CYTH domain-containing protein